MTDFTERTVRALVPTAFLNGDVFTDEALAGAVGNTVTVTADFRRDQSLGRATVVAAEQDDDGVHLTYVITQTPAGAARLDEALATSTAYSLAEGEEAHSHGMGFYRPQVREEDGHRVIEEMTLIEVAPLADPEQTPQALTAAQRVSIAERNLSLARNALAEASQRVSEATRALVDARREAGQ